MTKSVVDDLSMHMVSATVDAMPLHFVVSFSNATEAEIREARESVKP